MSRVSSSVGIGSPPCGSGSGGGGGGGGGVGGGGGGGGPCGACKFLRRKCVSGCIFAPYFNSVQGAAHFSAVHKVFGASNVSKLLRLIPPYKRLDAVVTICYEAQLRIRDPVYGCVGRILALQQQVANLQAELSCLQTHLAPQEPPPVTHAPPSQASPAAFFTPELPLASLLPGTFDLSTLFDPPLLLPWPPPLQQQQLDLRQLGRSGGGELTDNNQDGGDMQDLARELMERYSSASAEQPLSK